MRYPFHFRVLLVTSVPFVNAGLAAANDPEPPPGFVSLFNGRDLTGWHGWAIHEKGASPAEVAQLDPKERSRRVTVWTENALRHWKVENGELINDGEGVYLATDQVFGDIELLIEYKTVPRADSGIYLKATPQVQIWDSTDEAKFSLGADKGSGGLWNNLPGTPGKDPLVKADKSFGEWNRFRIIQVGEQTTVYLNNQLVVDHARLENFWDRGKPLPLKGPIVLQTHGGEIRWRNIFAREIPVEEANTLLLSKHSGGLLPIFDGQSLDGWDGAVNDYEVKDGAISCRPGKGGHVYTKALYSDFVVRLEYRLPPGGNNGLAIRYPGVGDPAYSGMCEIQILDDSDPRYAKIDPRQANGSAYGMIPAARGYLRPQGEWNVMEVTVIGPTIRVELNGYLILDGDLSKVSEFMANSPHPGKDRTAGHFGFAGHNDQVAFRNIGIKRLK